VMPVITAVLFVIRKPMIKKIKISI
jgi:hypothetical protein